MNLPVGLAVLPVALWRFRESYGGHPRLDIAGLVLATAGLFSITWAIVRADTTGWGSAAVIVPLLAGVAIVGAFLLWEWRTPHPMLSLALFRRASFSAANGISFCLFAGCSAVLTATLVLSVGEHTGVSAADGLEFPRGVNVQHRVQP